MSELTASAPLTPRQLVEMVTSRPGYTRAAGTEVLHAEVGIVHLRLRKRPDLLQFNGYFHGGVIAGLADHAAGGAVSTALPSGRIAVTIDLHVNYLAPARADTIVAKASTVQVGGSVGVARVEVFEVDAAGAERLCSIATATMRIVEMAAAGRG